MVTVAEALAKWNPRGKSGFEDCNDLYVSEYNRLSKAGHETQFIAFDAIGLWIVWNVLDRAPETQDECMLVRAAGAMVTYTFIDWWKE